MKLKAGGGYSVVYDSEGNRIPFEDVDLDTKMFCQQMNKANKILVERRNNGDISLGQVSMLLQEWTERANKET